MSPSAMQMQGQAQNGSSNTNRRFMMVSPVQQGASPLMRMAPSPQTRISPSPVTFVSRPQVGSFASPPQEGYTTVASPQMVQATLVPAQAVQPIQMQQQRYVAVSNAQAVQPVQPHSGEMKAEQQIAFVHTAPIRWETVDAPPQPFNRFFDMMLALHFSIKK